jgi:hypothetical protein
MGNVGISITGKLTGNKRQVILAEGDIIEWPLRKTFHKL